MDTLMVLSTRLSVMTSKLPWELSPDPLTSSKDSCTTSNTQHPTMTILKLISYSLSKAHSCSTVTGTNTLTSKANVKNVTQHAQADAPMVMSATNVTQAVALVPDTKSMNVSTAGVEPNVPPTDVVTVTAKLDSKTMVTNVNNKDASLKDVMPATRDNVSTADMGMTSTKELVMHVVRTIAKI